MLLQFTLLPPSIFFPTPAQSLSHPSSCTSCYKKVYKYYNIMIDFYYFSPQPRPFFLSKISSNPPRPDAFPPDPPTLVPKFHVKKIQKYTNIIIFCITSLLIPSKIFPTSLPPIISPHPHPRSMLSTHLSFSKSIQIL